MLLISTSHQPATDLGFLLHKNPNRVHQAEMSFGMATLVYPVAREDLCSAAVLLDVDSVGMVRDNESGLWAEYVNDRPYVASSFLSRLISEFFSTTMSGRCKDRPELAELPIPLEFHLPVLKCRGGEAMLRSLFEPLGYQVEATQIPLDVKFPEWGESRCFSVTLKITEKIKTTLAHLYVLVPVLDDDKHYWVDKNEVDKLLRRGGDWLASHPAREEITRRYMRYDRTLTREALARLAEGDGDPDPDSREEKEDEALEKVEATLSLHAQRIDAVAGEIKSLGASRVLDLGCGEGRLIQKLIRMSSITEIVGMDVSLFSLEKVKKRLRWVQLPETLKAKLKLIHGSLTYRDSTLKGYDAAALVEVIEHLDEARLASLERVVFESANPRNVIITTPNREYNDLFEGMRPGTMRHSDHRFEWTREEFLTWCQGISERRGYRFEVKPIGPVHEEKGAPSQMVVFTK